MQTSKLQYNDRDRPMRVYASAHRAHIHLIMLPLFTSCAHMRQRSLMSILQSKITMREYIIIKNGKVGSHIASSTEFLSNTLCVI